MSAPVLFPWVDGAEEARLYHLKWTGDGTKYKFHAPDFSPVPSTQYWHTAWRSKILMKESSPTKTSTLVPSSTCSLGPRRNC
jgi:hypothetical protein